MESLEEFFAAVVQIPFHFTVIAFAVVGTGLIIILVAQARGDRYAKLGRHRSEAPSVADLLNWASVIEDGVILNKNGSLMAMWLYRGNDNASATNADRNAISRFINAALKQLGSGWMFHIDAIRRPCPTYADPAFSHFPAHPVFGVMEP